MTNHSRPLIQIKAQIRLVKPNALIKQTEPQVIRIVPVADQVADIRVNSATGRVYFVHSENQVGVLDGTTNQIAANITAGDGTTFLAINPFTNRIYATNFRANTVAVIDGAANRVITSVPVGVHPYGIAVHAGSNRIYVANTSGSISVINGSTNRIIKTFRVGGSPVLLAVNEGTNRIYVTNVGSNSVHVINGATLTIRKTIKVGRNPIITPGIIPQTNRIYVANNLSRFVSAISGSTLGASVPISLGRLQSELAVNSALNRIYVTSAQQTGKGKLFVINGQTNRVVRTLTTPTFATLFVNPLTNRYYVGDTETRDLFVYSGLTNTLIAKLRTGQSAGNMAMNMQNNRIYVGNEKSITVVQDR